MLFQIAISLDQSGPANHIMIRLIILDGSRCARRSAPFYITPGAMNLFSQPPVYPEGTVQGAPEQRMAQGVHVQCLLLVTPSLS